MKHFLFILSILGVFSACNKSVEQLPTNNAAVPELVREAVTNNFADATNVSFTTLKANDLYSADFKSSNQQHTAVIDGKGTIKELTIQATTLVLPSSIMAYITANYPNATVNGSYEKRNPQTKALEGYAVQITTTAAKRLELTFNVAGVWLSTIDLPTVSVVSKYVIATFAELPENIQTLLNSRHAGLVFYNGTGVVIDNVTTYYIAVKVGDVVHSYSLSSTAAVLSYSSSSLTGTGTTSSTATQTSITNVSEIKPIIVTYLNGHFAGWQFLKGLNLYENKVLVSYLIVVQVNTDLYYIYFDANGGFTGAKKG